jgi:predicted dehydrogenase
LDEALAQKPDAVVIANPTSDHVPVALEAARASCHLFIEKPLSHTSDGLDELHQLVEQKKLVAFVGYQMRFHPCYGRVKELLDQNAIGALLAVRMQFGEYLPGWHPYEDYRESYAARRELGGGVVLTQIHDLDIALWLFGMPRRVFALGGHWSHLEVDVEDTASMLLQCEYSGRALPVHIQQDYLQKPPQRSVEIVGDSGRILLDLPTLRLEVTRDGATQIENFEGFDRNTLFLDEMRHFLDCVRDGAPPLVGVREGAQSLDIALAALRSVETGNVITL